MSSRFTAAADLHGAASNQRRFHVRLIAVATVVLLCFALLVWRWTVLQVLRRDTYVAQAENNRTATVPISPSRGSIVDRNGVVLATNYSAYTLELTPDKAGDVEATIEALSKIIPISEADKKRFQRLRQDSKSYEPIPLRNRLSDEEIARFAAQRFAFPGVEINARLFRYYPYGELSSHVLGYIARINAQEKQELEENDDALNYKGTTHIGKLGIEQSYESVLHGTSGSEQMEVTSTGQIVRKLTSKPAAPGQNVVLSIDIKLQKLVEDLFGQRRGALVAFDPRDGQVLAFVSKPTFDPNLFVDRIDNETWESLRDSPDKPLMNRALRGLYPPGSTYKPFMGLAALETGKRKPGDTTYDPGYWMFGKHRFRSPESGGLGTVNLHKAITLSSNVYFYVLAHDMGVDLIHDFMKPLGFGQITGIDLPGESRGTLPSTEWKRTSYKNPAMQKWYQGETISLGIGQGYNSFTMLQLAHALATVVNGGQQIQPRVVQGLQDPVTHQITPPPRDATVPLGYQPQHVELIKSAMANVTKAGTSTAIFAGAGYQSGGKTGTAQAVTQGQNQRYNARGLAEHKRDHSLYIAFAPEDKPTIALAVIVENAGWGATAAAPIARRVLDYWLLGQYPSAADIAATQVGKSRGPIGTPRKAAEVPWPPEGMSVLVPISSGDPASSTDKSAALHAVVAASGTMPVLAVDAQPASAAPAPHTASAANPASAAPAYAAPPEVQRMNQLFARAAQPASSTGAAQPASRPAASTLPQAAASVAPPASASGAPTTTVQAPPAAARAPRPMRRPSAVTPPPTDTD